jgi:hypothetical protein
MISSFCGFLEIDSLSRWISSPIPQKHKVSKPPAGQKFRGRSAIIFHVPPFPFRS